MKNPKYPVYIISKGRWESRLTAKALMKRSIPFSIVIEPQEFEEYSRVIPRENILVLPFSNLGQGSIPARNWVWEHSIQQGADRHWILDDNIRSFFRLTNNIKYRTTDGSTFVAIEECVDRYENVALAGMQYAMFTPRRKVFSPVIINTRVYSCILIQNNLPFRWRGKYNEDTDLSLNVLKSGLCTILFNAFPCEKMATMTMRGGNTNDLYQDKGRLKMALSLKKQHPEITRIVWKWGRWQHHVDYSSFKNNPLILKEGITLSNSINEFGMVLTK